VAEFLVPLFEDKEITFYEGIKRLPPASCLLVKNDGHRIWSFWNLDHVTETRLGSDEEYQEAFLDIFSESVNCRLRSAFPVGSMLSGGLDSSSIATVARDFLTAQGDKKLHTFSAIFDEVKECDERDYIQPVLDQGGFEPHYLHADRIGPLTEMDRILWTQDEAIFSPNRFMHWGLYKQASEQNVRVLLDGIDGDTTVSHGVTRLVELTLGWKWKTLAEEINAIAKRSGNSFSRVGQVAVLKPLLPIWLYDGWRSIRGLPPKYRVSNPTINPDFARRINLNEHFEDLIQVWLQPERQERYVHQRRLEWGLHPCVSEGLNKTASVLGVEPRYPFFDKRLVEFCLSLPSKYKLRNGWTRWILRTSLDGILPSEVQWRKMKTSLGPNFTHGFLGLQQTQIEDIVYGDYAEIGNYIEKKALVKVYEHYRITKSATDEMYLWTAIILSTWLKRSIFNNTFAKK
jgi:asparagine synthase (glutamine-hydrolysing)